MENHTTKFNNVHTQLLLQMQIDSNIQEMKERLHSTQKELHATQNELKTKENTLLTTQSELKETQNELQTSKLKLEQTMVELNHAKKDATKCQSQIKLHEKTQLKLEQTMMELNNAKEDATKCQSQIKFLQKNIQKHIENGFKLNHQITESFASYLSTTKQKLICNESIEVVFKSLETKQPLPKPTNQIEQIGQIEPIEINGMKLEFPKINEFVQNLNKSYKHEMLLKKMENGEIHHIDDQQFIFKLNLPKNHRKLVINHSDDIASLATEYAKCVVVKNDQLVVLDNPCNDDGYEIYLQIPNYDNGNSHSYLYSKNENGDKLLLKNSLSNNVHMDDYRTPSNEVLFHITK